MSDYCLSQGGWSRNAKRQEMKLSDLKYLLVKHDGAVQGFASIMPTFEDGYSVVYCYEIHLTPSIQNTGLGRILMQQIHQIGGQIPDVVKVMLTCFVRNQRGIEFYRKLGFVKDEFSPAPKILRNGTKVEADYVILSKPIVR